MGLPKLYSVNPETGEIKPLQRTIGHLHTKVSASSKNTVLEDTGLSEFEIGSHTHETLEEYDRQERTGFAAPIGAVTGIYGNVAWISEKLTASPAAEAVATPEIITKTLVEDVAQEATKTSRPERRKLERATKKFVEKESVQQDLETLHHANRVLAAAREQEKGNALAQKALIGPWSDPHTQWSGGNVQDMPLEQFLQTPLGNQRVSREEVEHAQTVASQAWGRIKNEASEFVENNPKASKAIGNFLWGAAEGLRGWYYFEAAKTGMLVGGAVAGPAGVLFGGAAGLLVAYGTENVTQAATAGGIELAAQLVGGADGQVIREAAPLALTALGLRTAREVIGKVANKNSNSAKNSSPYGHVLTQDHIPTSSKITALQKPGYVKFDDVEFRAIRNLEHLDVKTLNQIARTGKNPPDTLMKPLAGHHYQQKYHREPGAFIVEIPETAHKISNKIQHPYGNQRDMGLTSAQRADWNKTRRAFNKERARNELLRRNLLEK